MPVDDLEQRDGVIFLVVKRDNEQESFVSIVAIRNEPMKVEVNGRAQLKDGLVSHLSVQLSHRQRLADILIQNLKE